MRDVVVGTAGHIDHGKTLLVKAMTGMDADRWDEEKRRGITLDIGFATLDSERGRLHFVDLPGHERFVKNMLAGATGIDLCLLVVAADESVMPQTVEHADILSLLGVKRGVVALNKVDLVDRETRELALMELSEFLESCGLSGMPIVEVSAVTGEGLPDLLAAIYGEAESCPAPPRNRPFRLPIDRVFPIKGFGTVVTGTCIDGSLAVGDRVLVYPDGGESRVRGLQIFGRSVEEAVAGQRVAVNLPDIRHADLARGHMAAMLGSCRPTHLLDVRLGVLASAKRSLKTGAVCTLHIHTQEVEAHVHLSDSAALAPGDEGLAQIRTTVPVVAWPDDRFILRLPSPARTIGGGTVLLPARRKARWRRRRDRTIADLLRGNLALRALLVEAGPAGLTPDDVMGVMGVKAERLNELAESAESAEALVRWGNGGWWLEAAEAEAWLDRAGAWLSGRYDGKAPVSWVPRQELLGRWLRVLGQARGEALVEALERAGRIEVEGDRIRPAGHRVRLSDAQKAAWQAVQAILCDPETFIRTGKELESAIGSEARQVLPLMVEDGELVRYGGDFFVARTTMESLREKLAAHAISRSTKISVPEFKSMLGLSRKYVMPLLEHLDDLKWTRRSGDGRDILVR
jgi:selenocysteine-specific elongation factor